MKSLWWWTMHLFVKKKQLLCKRRVNFCKSNFVINEWVYFNLIIQHFAVLFHFILKIYETVKFNISIWNNEYGAKNQQVIIYKHFFQFFFYLNLQAIKICILSISSIYRHWCICMWMKLRWPIKKLININFIKMSKTKNIGGVSPYAWTVYVHKMLYKCNLYTNHVEVK